MKDYLDLKKHILPNHVERPFFQALKFTAKEHGYVGFLARPRFLFRRSIDYFLQLISKVLPYSGVKIWLHRKRGVKIGKHVHIGPMVTIDDVYPNFVIIEDGVAISGQNFILTHSKAMEYHKYLSESFIAPVIIKKNAWITIGVIILPGVTIGEGAIVTAGSVVNTDIPPNTLAGGIPAKVIGERENKNPNYKLGRARLFQ